MTTDIPEVVGFATHHDEPMLFPNRKEAAAYCDDGEDPVALIRLSDYEKLARYYKNGIDCFANPCERHSGERTPPFSEFFEKYGGQCLICVVDNNKALQAECEKLRSIISDLKGWDCDVRGGFLSIPVDLRSRMQEAIDGAMQEVT